MPGFFCSCVYSLLVDTQRGCFIVLVGVPVKCSPTVHRVGLPHFFTVFVFTVEVGAVLWLSSDTTLSLSLPWPLTRCSKVLLGFCNTCCFPPSTQKNCQLISWVCFAWLEVFFISLWRASNRTWNEVAVYVTSQEAKAPQPNYQRTHPTGALFTPECVSANRSPYALF